MQVFLLKFAKFLRTLVFVKQLYLYVTLYFMKKKQLARRNYENFEKAVKFLSNYFLKKVISWMFGMVLNTPLSYYDSTCYYNTIQQFLAENPSKVLNGQHQHKGVIFHRSKISPSFIKLLQSPSLLSLFIMQGKRGRRHAEEKYRKTK